jgi:hypothetical protein
LRVKLIALAVLLLFLSAGCGGIPINNSSSPLGNGGDGLTECIPDPSGTTLTDGINVLENHSNGTVTVEKVSYYGAHHPSFVRAVIVAIRHYSIGISLTWPPASEPGEPNGGANHPRQPVRRSGERNVVHLRRRRTAKGNAPRHRKRYASA